jgi:signal transduction histidine kinase
MFTTPAETPDGSFSESVPAIAHDLNNNMQMVLSALDLMRCCLAQGRPADTALYVERAVESAERVTKLGRRLMRSRDCVVNRFVGVDVKSAIEKMRPIISQITGGSIELSLSLAEDLRPVSCDSLDFENALLNLVLNARDAMPAGGRLRVETSRLFVDKTPLRAGPYAVVAVTDTGIGMTPDIARDAFDPYFTTKAPGRGTGLGLPSVKAFAVGHGGGIQAKSILGEGTVVTIYLPEQPEEEPLPRLLCNVDHVSPVVR